MQDCDRFRQSTTNLLQLTEQGTDIFEAGVDGDVNFVLITSLLRLAKSQNMGRMLYR